MNTGIIGGDEETPYQEEYRGLVRDLKALDMLFHIRYIIYMRNPPSAMPKPLRFAGDSRKEISEMPLPVKTKFGYALRDVQNRDTPVGASPFEGSRANEIMKLTARFDGDTYRCVYAAKFPKAVYVLYVFQKKSRSGIATPQRDIDTVYARYAQAQSDYETAFGKQ